MELYLTLLSTISSPHLQTIFLIFNVKRFVRKGELDAKVFAYDGWGAVEEVFLQLATKSRYNIDVVVFLSTMKRTSSVPKVPECETFMSRFKKVGRVEVMFLQKREGSY